VKRYLLLILGAGLLTSHASVGQSKSQSIQGAWQAVEVTIPGATPRTFTIPEPRPNLTVLTARHYSRVQVEAEGPPTGDRRRDEGDRRRIAGRLGTVRCRSRHVRNHRPPDHAAASRGEEPCGDGAGAFTTWSYRLDGTTLWVTAERNQNGPMANPVTVKSVRVE
jgi:hypothetical protein